MTFSVTMPALGESVSEGTVTRWLKAEGDHVAVDEPLLEVSTDKVDTEIPSPVAGILQKIVVAVDTTVLVGAELAVIADGAAAPVATLLLLQLLLLLLQCCYSSSSSRCTSCTSSCCTCCCCTIGRHRNYNARSWRICKRRHCHSLA
jgi:pyruvate/2-oxoglutarate dehydrogenase complex dihydrolipoamide acyltransferase (E2) component